MQITFGNTDGDAEANALSGMVGYVVKIVREGEIAYEDIEIDTVSNAGLYGSLRAPDTGEPVLTESGWPVVRGYQWIDIAEVHVY